MKTVFVFILGLGLFLSSSGLALADYSRGKKAYEEQNWMRALTDLRAATHNNNTKAMILLGNMYAEGKGVSPNPETAYRYYLRAARLGDTEAMIATASLLASGIGIEKNTEAAHIWFEHAARLGNPAGMVFHAINIYEDQPAAALKWFLLAEKGRYLQYQQIAAPVVKKLRQTLPAIEVAAAEKAADAFTPASLKDVLPEAMLTPQSPVPTLPENDSAPPNSEQTQ